MHYIQNGWFEHNWLWVMLLMMGAICVVSYINNRSVLLKRSLIFFVLLLIAAMSVSLTHYNYSSLALKSETLTKLIDKPEDIHKSSLFTKVVNYIVEILKDKLNN